jgi:hypothetical protein
MRQLTPGSAQAVMQQQRSAALGRIIKDRIAGAFHQPY